MERALVHALWALPKGNRDVYSAYDSGCTGATFAALTLATLWKVSAQLCFMLYNCYGWLDVISVIAHLIGLTCNSQKVFCCGVWGEFPPGELAAEGEQGGVWHGLEVKLIITWRVNALCYAHCVFSLAALCTIIMCHSKDSTVNSWGGNTKPNA